MKNNPFANKNLRSIYDHGEKKWWFSAVDVCAILTDSDYNTAREYWKKFKYNLSRRENDPVAFCDQIRMPSKDGRYFFTDVLGIKDVVYLIQIIPSPKAEPFRLWLADVVASSTTVEAQLVEAGEEDAKQILEEYKKNPRKLSERKVVTRTRIV